MLDWTMRQELYWLDQFISSFKLFVQMMPSSNEQQTVWIDYHVDSNENIVDGLTFNDPVKDLAVVVVVRDHKTLLVAYGNGSVITTKEYPLENGPDVVQKVAQFFTSDGKEIL